MKSKYLWLTIAVLTLSGCPSKGEPPSHSTDASSIFGKPSVAGPGMTDDFGLPLIIDLEAPEVPEELLGPSPPLTNQQKTPLQTPKKTPQETPRKKPAPKTPSPGS
jgi:hypothetical protein